MTTEIRSVNPCDDAARAAIVNDWIDATDRLPRQHSCEVIEDMTHMGSPLREL